MTSNDATNEEQCCRLCAHWAGTEQHVISDAPAKCARSRIPNMLWYANEWCGAFTDAARRAA